MRWMKITHGLDVSSINTRASEMIIQKNLSIGARVDEAEVEISLPEDSHGRDIWAC